MTHLDAGALLIHPEVLQAAAMDLRQNLQVKAENGRIVIEPRLETAPEKTPVREGRVILFGRIDDLLLSGEGG
jgi:hypothetical protein